MSFSPAIYKARREAVIADMEEGAIAILPAAKAATRSRDTEYSYRQDSNFLYLTGFEEPEAWLVLSKRGEVQSLLFCRERNKEKEIWEGLMAGPEGAVEKFGLDRAYPLTALDAQIVQLFDGCNAVYLCLGQDVEFEAQVSEWISAVKAKARTGAKAPNKIVNLEPIVHEKRLIKSPEEIEVLRESCALAAKAHTRAMRFCAQNKDHEIFEYQLEAEILHEFAMSGARHAAYNTIVGGGKNGCILHYTENNQVLHKGDLVLIDAGCEHHHFAADITRTFPVGGKFSSEQKALYELTLAAQDAALAEVYPGNPWIAPHDASVKTLTQGLVKLGLLQGDVNTLIKDEAYKRFYMHRVGHWLGMDVHDVGDYKEGGNWRALEPGMVMTIEPGLYVAIDDETVDVRWRGIGIRIEDDVLVTEQGAEVLTAGVVKTVEDIEALMA